MALQGSSTHTLITMALQGSSTHSLITMALQGSSTHSLITMALQGSSTHSLITMALQGSSTHSLITMVLQGSSTHSLITMASLLSGRKKSWVLYFSVAALLYSPTLKTAKLFNLIYLAVCVNEQYHHLGDHFFQIAYIYALITFHIQAQFPTSAKVLWGPANIHWTWYHDTQLYISGTVSQH